MGVDQYEEVPISEASGAKLVNALTPLPVASHVAIEELDTGAPTNAVEQHFSRLNALREESIRLQAESEADRRSNAMLMGYVDSGTENEPPIQPNLTYGGQYEDADDPLARQQQNEVPVAGPQDYEDMPELLTSDEEDDWNPHKISCAYPEEEDDMASMCPVAQSPRSTYLALDLLQERTQQLVQKTAAAQKSPLESVMAGLHAALEASSTTTDDLSQCEFHSTSELLPDVAELYSTVINHSDVKFDPGLQASYDLRYGPFEVDACCDDQGYNAYCAVYWSPSNSFTRHS